MSVNTTARDQRDQREQRAGWIQPYTRMYRVSSDGTGWYAVWYTDATGAACEAKLADRETAIVIVAALRSDDSLARHAALALIDRLDYA